MTTPTNRKLERERADRARLLRGWLAWHRDERNAVLAGPRGAMFERLLFILKNSTPQSAPVLLNYMRGVDLSDVDYPTRLVMLHEINRAIAAVRERGGLAPYSDPLPGEPENLSRLIKQHLFPA
jgi:hypothetical protein